MNTETYKIEYLDVDLNVICTWDVVVPNGDVAINVADRYFKEYNKIDVTFGYRVTSKNINSIIKEYTVWN